jgi:hypothetical protein
MPPAEHLPGVWGVEGNGSQSEMTLRTIAALSIKPFGVFSVGKGHENS